MTEEAAFLRAICDRPEDNTARLIYADWLDEQGSDRQAARAELIRTQIELAKRPCLKPVAREIYNFVLYGNMPIDFVYERCGTCERCRGKYAELTARVEYLLKKWGAGWIPHGLRPVSYYPEVTGATIKPNWALSLNFERGFIGSAICHLPRDLALGNACADEFTAQLASLFASGPLTAFGLTFDRSALMLSGQIVREDVPDSTEGVWVVKWTPDNRLREYVGVGGISCTKRHLVARSFPDLILPAVRTLLSLPALPGDNPPMEWEYDESTD